VRPLYRVWGLTRQDGERRLPENTSTPVKGRINSSANADLAIARSPTVGQLKEKPGRPDSWAYRHVIMMRFSSADVRPWVDVPDDAV